jgi:hypothetical protein
MYGKSQVKFTLQLRFRGDYTTPLHVMHTSLELQSTMAGKSDSYLLPTLLRVA